MLDKLVLLSLTAHEQAVTWIQRDDIPSRPTPQELHIDMPRSNPLFFLQKKLAAARFDFQSNGYM